MLRWQKPEPNRKVFLTPKGRRFRDAYPAVLRNTEDAWSKTHGAVEMKRLRAALESMAPSFETDLPEYPDSTRWFRELHAGNPR